MFAQISKPRDPRPTLAEVRQSAKEVRQSWSRTERRRRFRVGQKKRAEFVACLICGANSYRQVG